MDQQKFGAFLRQLRKEKGLTQEQLAEQLGVTNRSVSRWETGANLPDFDLVLTLADTFGVTIEELLDGERRTNMPITDPKQAEILLKTADYSNQEKIRLSKRMTVLFSLSSIAFIVYMVIEQLGLSSTGIYEDIASASLGFALGMQLVGVLYSSGTLHKACTFKERVLFRRGKPE